MPEPTFTTRRTSIDLRSDHDKLLSQIQAAMHETNGERVTISEAIGEAIEFAIENGLLRNPIR